MPSDPTRRAYERFAAGNRPVDNGDVIGVRRLESDDWRLWRDLRLRALASAPEAFRTRHAYWSGPHDVEANWRRLLADRPLNAALTWDDVPVGMVSATHPVDDGAVELHSMWVDAAARGRGVGDAAVRVVLDWTRERHRGRPVELCVKAGNASAIALYVRHGFVDAGTPPGHPDERLMRRPG